MKKKIINWVLVVFFVLTILYLSTRPITSQSSIKYLDKLAHIVFYSGLSFLSMKLLPAKSHYYRIKLVLIFFIVGFYGLLIEYLQSFIPYRSASIGDALANYIGAGLGIGILFLYTKFRQRGKYDSRARRK